MGWNVALLRSLGKMTAEEKEKFKLVHRDLIRDCLKRGVLFPTEKCEDAQKV
jgi:hypothetical protein